MGFSHTFGGSIRPFWRKAGKSYKNSKPKFRSTQQSHLQEWRTPAQKACISMFREALPVAFNTPKLETTHMSIKGRIMADPFRGTLSRSLKNEIDLHMLTSSEKKEKQATEQYNTISHYRGKEILPHCSGKFSLIILWGGGRDVVWLGWREATGVPPLRFHELLSHSQELWVNSSRSEDRLPTLKSPLHHSLWGLGQVASPPPNLGFLIWKWGYS